MRLLDVGRHSENVAVIHVRHADDQFKVALFEHFERLFLGGYLRKAGWGTQAKGIVFVENLFVNASVVFQYKRIVSRSYNQDVVDALIHEVGKGRVS